MCFELVDMPYKVFYMTRYLLNKKIVHSEVLSNTLAYAEFNKSTIMLNKWKDANTTLNERREG